MQNLIKLVLLVVVTFYSFGMICCLQNSSSDFFLNNTGTVKPIELGTNGSNGSNGSNENNDNVPDNEKTR